MENRNDNTKLSPEFHFKLLFYFGLFFLVGSAFIFKSEDSVKIPKFDNLFITEGILKRPAVSGRKYPSIFVLTPDNRLIKLSTYRGYEIHKLRKFQNSKIKVWWYSNNLKKIYNPNYINSLYQAEIAGEIIIKFDDQKKQFESRPRYKGTIFSASISFIFLLLALMGYINMLDSKKSPNLN